MENLKELAGRLLDFDFSRVEIVPAGQVLAKCSNGAFTAGGKDAAQQMRALMLVAKHAGEGDFEICQSPQFESCGVMLDVSRNGVMRVEKVKEYLSYMALHGLNMLMLYTEDVYELKEYPYFGYLRGRYSEAELKEIDDFAYGLGIEVVPCVQTLGHLEQYLRWKEAAPIKDTERVLLCGEEESYRFIEAILSTMRRTLRSKRIHVGMDEAHDVGLGAYLAKHGYQNRFDILNRHLTKVCELCKKYGFKPLMWSDMFFRLGSKTGDYYDLESNIPQEAIQMIPDVGLVYWDYYHTEENIYQKMVENHLKMGKELLFAGGIWTWCGFLADLRFTYESMLPALKVCSKNKVENVFATMWGDDGCETNHFFSLPGLALFSEFCYVGEETTQEQIIEMSEFITKFDNQAVEAMSSFHGDKGGFGMGKRLVWSDILYNLTGIKEDYDRLSATLAQAQRVLEASGGKWKEFYAYAALVLKVASLKAKVLGNLRPSYLKQDRKALQDIEQKLLPELLESYHALCASHEALWRSTYKINGWEVIAGRYGAMIARTEYAIRILSQYLDGQLSEIEELSEAPLLDDPGHVNYSRLHSTSCIR